ncbi:unnamed protein product [Rotaria socialis]|uniref:Uncharacterized protein n=1 Tax=Rotaria socialis TaxID=392032 RepID=A0A820P3V6_9BILA|nr:unnamed protein product [Rotaria socialis]
MGFILIGSLLSLSGEIYIAISDIGNNTIMEYSGQRMRTGARLAVYIVNIVPTILAFYYMLNTYINIIKKSDVIRKLFLGRNEQLGIKRIKDCTYDVFRLNTRSSERNELYCANTFASICIVCYLVWGLIYAYYVLAMQTFIRIDLYLKTGGQFVVCTTLIIIMWITNQIVDNMKRTIAVVQLVDDEPIIDVITMSLIVESCEPYASLFTIKPSLPGIIITILSGMAPLILPYVKQRLHF